MNKFSVHGFASSWTRSPATDAESITSPAQVQHKSSRSEVAPNHTHYEVTFVYSLLLLSCCGGGGRRCGMVCCGRRAVHAAAESCNGFLLLCSSRPKLPGEVMVESPRSQPRTFYAQVFFANEICRSLELAALEVVSCSFDLIG